MFVVIAVKSVAFPETLTVKASTSTDVTTTAALAFCFVEPTYTSSSAFSDPPQRAAEKVYAVITIARVVPDPVADAPTAIGIEP